MAGEKIFDGHANAQFDDLVAVDKAHTQFAGQLPTDCRFAAARHAHQSQHDSESLKVRRHFVQAF